MINKTISLKLSLTIDQKDQLLKTASLFINACNEVVPIVQEHKCWNKVMLHHLEYYKLRGQFNSLGSQLTCNSIKKVANAYKSLKSNKRLYEDEQIVKVVFKQPSVHYDKRTYSLKNNKLSLFTTSGRIKVDYKLGNYQENILKSGIAKEADLVWKKGKWYFNLVIELPETALQSSTKVLGVDVGENNLAAISTGSIYGGGAIKHKRDRYLAKRINLQSNGSKAAKRKLRQISGTESRYVKHMNHVVSKTIVTKAIKNNVGIIGLENLTGIRDRIKAKKRVRARLHKWAFRQLQDFIKYKAEAVGIKVIFINPVFTSQTCSLCGKIGSRVKHSFTCKCGVKQHSDVNASVNIAKLAKLVNFAKVPVNAPILAAWQAS